MRSFQYTKVTSQLVLFVTSHDSKLLAECTTEDNMADIGVNELVRKLQRCLPTYIKDPTQSAMGPVPNEDTNAPEPSNPKTSLTGLPPGTSTWGGPSSSVQDALNELFEQLLGDKTGWQPQPTTHDEDITHLEAFFLKKPVPTAADYTKLEHETNMARGCIIKWFKNRRRRIRWATKALVEDDDPNVIL